MDYKLNKEKAMSAGMGGYITASGFYEGVFIEVKEVTASTSTKGIEFAFEDTNGAKANYMTIYTQKANGDALYGEDMIHAMMTCMKLKEMPLRDGRYTAAEGAMIGLVLQKEEYEKKDKSTGYKMNILHFYQPGTNLMADEIFDRKPAERLEKITVKDKLLEAGKQMNETK